MPHIDILQQGRGIGTTEGVIGFCSTILVEGQQRVLLDTGHVGRRTGLEAALAERNLSCADIDVVVLTHAHWDHGQNLDLFPDARVLLHPDERRYSQRPHRNDWATPAWTGNMLEHHRGLEEVDEGVVIEPGVSILHTPGHSPGCLSLLVETDDGVAALTGDVLHFADVALTRRNPLVFWDVEQANRSIDRILDVADHIYPGHDLPFRLVNDRIEYLATSPITVTGVDPDDPASLGFDRTRRQPWVMPGIEEQRLT